MIPAIQLMALPASPSRSALMIGMPPATAPSKPTQIPAFRAAGSRLAPRVAISALFAVTMFLLASMHCWNRRPAASTPPIVSTTTSTRGSATTSATSVEKGTPSGMTDGFGVRLAIRTTSIGRPACRAIAAPLAASNASTPWPTVPIPHRPIRSGCTVEIPFVQKSDGGSKGAGNAIESTWRSQREVPLCAQFRRVS